MRVPDSFGAPQGPWDGNIWGSSSLRRPGWKTWLSRDATGRTLVQISGTLALTQPHAFHQGPSRRVAHQRVVRASVDWLDAERPTRVGRTGMDVEVSIPPAPSQVINGKPQRLRARTPPHQRRASQASSMQLLVATPSSAPCYTIRKRGRNVLVRLQCISNAALADRPRSGAKLCSVA